MTAITKKGFLSTQRGKVVFCIGGLLFSLLFLMWTLDIELASLFPSDSRLTELRDEETKARSRYEDALARYNAVRTTENAYFAEIADYWYMPEQGDPETEPRQLIENALKAAELRLNIGTVRRSKINTDIYALEMDLSGSAALEPLTQFLRAMHDASPRVFWKRVELRSDPRQSDGLLNFSGTLRLMGREKALPATAQKGQKS